MVDIQQIIADHRPKSKVYEEDHNVKKGKSSGGATSSEIPDLFFDKILVQFKLSRIEIMVNMYLYRLVWCRPNLYKEFGISQIMSHTELAKILGVEIEDIYQALRKLEEYGFISTVRSGQYFVRRYFTKENDEFYFQNYNDFEF